MPVYGNTPPATVDQQEYEGSGSCHLATSGVTIAPPSIADSFPEIDVSCKLEFLFFSMASLSVPIVQ